VCPVTAKARPGLPAQQRQRGASLTPSATCQPSPDMRAGDLWLLTARPNFLHSSSGRAVRKVDASCSNLSTLP
jgi:hypothetical protein